MTTAEIRITKARTHLLLDHPWFGSLAMRLAIEPRADVDTMATDGSHLYYSPEFVDQTSDKHLQAILAHEVMHCVLQHMYRLGSRDLEQWNIATDYVINNELLAAGFELPPDVLIDPQYAGMSGEAVYALLAKNPQPDQNGKPSPTNPQGAQDPNGAPAQQDPSGAPGPLSTGNFTPAPPTGQGAAGAQQSTPEGMTASDWTIAAEQATAVSKAAGDAPGGAIRAAKAARESVEDWRATLRDFVEHQQPSDYSWAAPNRRHIADGLYLPGVRKENLGTIAVAVDTSGSISERMLQMFADELTAILHEARPDRVDVIYCDTKVRHTESFSPDDEKIELGAHGGGGTRFAPVFDHMVIADEPPACLLYFTDLECSDKPQEPDYPVLWVTGIDVQRSAPFGRTVRIDAWQD